MQSMQCMWKMEKGWKHRVPLASNGIHDNKGEKNPFKKIKEKWLKLFSPKDISPFFLFPPANHALSCMQPSSLFPVREILMQRSLTQTESILTMSPKVNVSIDPTHHLEKAVHEPAPALWVVSWVMLIATKLSKAGTFPVVSHRVMEWMQTSSSSFPKELLLHTPLVTQQMWGLLYPHPFCLIKNQTTAAIISK